MKNNKKALSSPSGLFYIQDELADDCSCIVCTSAIHGGRISRAWMHRSDDIFKFELFFVLYFLFLWSAL